MEDPLLSRADQFFLLVGLLFHILVSDRLDPVVEVLFFWVQGSAVLSEGAFKVCCLFAI